ncbi:MAG TPA: carboxylesterase family protein [Trebonia sp.]|jgi:para-nitrobenzyl esterase|nr:carboxylesterase family protein [Trebonia sp.]
MTVAETAGGTLRGAEIADGVLGWRGIPYARPPIGPLRFRPPEPPDRWAGPRDAVEYGNRSLQPEPIPDPQAPPMSEDCLYLNVTAPAGAAGRPVLLWLHGGGFEMGQGPNQAGDGVAFTQSHGLVVVTVNYRLGALGFLEVPGEHPTGAAGLHDQIAALRWTHQNIAAFGGDPGQITVYGLSAGAKSVTNLLASPLTRGMIARAAESSGGDHVKDQAQGRALTERFLFELGAGPDRLRAAPALDLLHAQLAVAGMPRSTWVWRPSVDGVALTDSPLTAIAAGSAAGIPLLLQTCAREAAMFALLAAEAPRHADGALAGYFGRETAARLLAGYAARYPNLDELALRTVVMTDERYVVPTERLADAQAAHAPVWRSRYDGPYTGLEGELAHYAARLAGAHGGDGAAVWQGDPDGAVVGLSRRMHDAWGTFATTGDPGWAQYASQERPAMIFMPGDPHVETGPFAATRAAWSGLTWQPGPWWPITGLT